MHVKPFISLLLKTKNTFVGSGSFGSWKRYGVGMISRPLSIMGLFCRKSSFSQGSFTKETYNLKEPTNRSHPIYAECLTLNFYQKKNEGGKT